MDISSEEETCPPFAYVTDKGKLGFRQQLPPAQWPVTPLRPHRGFSSDSLGVEHPVKRSVDPGCGPGDVSVRLVQGQAANQPGPAELTPASTEASSTSTQLVSVPRPTSGGIYAPPQLAGMQDLAARLLDHCPVDAAAHRAAVKAKAAQASTADEVSAEGDANAKGKANAKRKASAKRKARAKRKAGTEGEPEGKENTKRRASAQGEAKPEGKANAKRKAIAEGEAKPEGKASAKRKASAEGEANPAGKPSAKGEASATGQANPMGKANPVRTGVETPRRTMASQSADSSEKQQATAQPVPLQQLRALLPDGWSERVQVLDHPVSVRKRTERNCTFFQVCVGGRSLGQCTQHQFGEHAEVIAHALAALAKEGVGKDDLHVAKSLYAQTSQSKAAMQP